MFRSAVAVALSLQAIFPASLPQGKVSPDTPEPGSVEAIAAATGDPRFLSPLVAYLPLSRGVPSPLAFFDRIMGAPGEFVNTTKAYAYCRALAAASPRVRMFTIGRSDRRGGKTGWSAGRRFWTCRLAAGTW